jgi:hypothetical protein
MKVIANKGNDSEEEVFQDVDRILDEVKKTEVSSNKIIT